ncbi:hypothetical protein BGX29_011003 [Mortierella sp. GBA35]|nr:hypothetical protein BGX29_011003 [Mortierella sp. GBA35]
MDSAHYALPPNIYDNIPPGLVTPTSFKTYPLSTPTPAPDAPSISPRDTTSGAAVVGAESTAGGGIETELTGGFDITTPLLNSIYTPGAGLIMTWSNCEMDFSESWTPPQAILDMITNDPGFSNSPLLTTEDMCRLAKMKVQELWAAQQANVIKDSPIWLKSLRLVSWPLAEGASVSGDEATVARADTTAMGMMTALSPKILTDPGFSLINASNNNHSAKLTILGSAGGQLMWMIPEDWEYEGEFEIVIPSPPGGPSSSSSSASASFPGHNSRSFWILRDSATRQRTPQYTLPSMDQQALLLALGGDGSADGSNVGRIREDIQRRRDMSVFLGVAAMMMAFVLLGLGVVIGMYRRRWAAQEAAAAAAAAASGSGSGSGSLGTLSSSRHGSSSNLESANANANASSPACYTGTGSYAVRPVLRKPMRTQYAEYTSSSTGLVMKRQNSSLLDPIQDDEDAHSPKDMDLENLSVETLGCGDGGLKERYDEKAIESGSGGYGGSESGGVTPVDESFVNLPLYESLNDSSSTLASGKQHHP